MKQKVSDFFGCSQNDIILGQAARFAHIQTALPAPDKFYFSNYPGIVGIEVEVEHFQFNPDLHLWKCEKDGSLKDNGREFISVPLQGKLIDYALKEIKTQFDDVANWYFNHRCSVHTHINVAQLTCQQLVSLIGLFMRLEPYFFAYADPMREGNSYCFPLADVLPTRELLFNNDNWRQNSKYASLGMNHLNDYGTVELRILEGTMNPVKLRRWIMMLQKIFKYILINKFENKLLEYHDNRTTEDLAREVFNTVFKFLPPPDAYKLRMARDASFFFMAE